MDSWIHGFMDSWIHGFGAARRGGTKIKTYNTITLVVLYSGCLVLNNGKPSIACTQSELRGYPDDCLP